MTATGRSGLNVWVPVREEAATVAHLAAAGWAVRAGERYRMKSPPAIRITVSTLTARETAPAGRRRGGIAARRRAAPRPRRAPARA